MCIALGVFSLAGMFIWAALRPPSAAVAPGDADRPVASVTEVLPEGRFDLQVYALGNLGVRLELQFTPDADALDTAGMRPDVNFAMLEMHRDGIEPPLELVGPGAWRARLTLPMAGRWVVSAGFGEDRAEVEFDAR